MKLNIFSGFYVVEISLFRPGTGTLELCIVLNIKLLNVLGVGHEQEEYRIVLILGINCVGQKQEQER